MPEQTGTEYTLENAEDHISGLIGSVNVLGEAHTMDDANTPPDNPATGQIRFSSSGQDKYASSDGNDYNTGRNTLNANGALSLTTSLQTVPGLSSALAVGSYRIEAQLLITNPGTAGQGAMAFQVTGTGGLTASGGRSAVLEFGATGSVATADFATLGTLLTSGTAPGTGGLNRVVRISGYYTISVAGTINIQIKQAATAACTVVQNGTFLEVMPVS